MTSFRSGLIQRLHGLGSCRSGLLDADQGLGSFGASLHDAMPRFKSHGVHRFSQPRQAFCGIVRCFVQICLRHGSLDITEIARAQCLENPPRLGIPRDGLQKDRTVQWQFFHPVPDAENGHGAKRLRKHRVLREVSLCGGQRRLAKLRGRLSRFTAQRHLLEQQLLKPLHHAASVGLGAHRGEDTQPSACGDLQIKARKQPLRERVGEGVHEVNPSKFWPTEHPLDYPWDERERRVCRQARPQAYRGGSDTARSPYCAQSCGYGLRLNWSSKAATATKCPRQRNHRGRRARRMARRQSDLGGSAKVGVGITTTAGQQREAD
mmetsp:Transcript_54375/g.151481  ORF Transcript_54375/g.151481 Transcript_54375/m.151481 type:complete len:321 (+) Transcript_54375:233-1195(+)